MNITQKRINYATHIIIDIYKYTCVVAAMKDKFICDGIDFCSYIDEKKRGITEGEYLIMANDLKEKSEMSDMLNTFMKDTIQFISILFKKKGHNSFTITKKLKAIIDLASDSYNKEMYELFHKENEKGVCFVIIEKYLNERLENIRAVKPF